MITLLRKLFIKNYTEVDQPDIRKAHGKMASLVGIISNLFLFVVKLFVGILGNSISIIGDSVNNLSDMGSSVITLFGFKISGKPADKEHPYGHERMEYVAGLIVSIIIAVGVQLIIQSFTKIFQHTAVSYSSLTLIILGVSILVKLWQGLFNRKMGKLIHSVSLEATATDSLNDVLATFVILVGVGIHMIWKVNVDGYLGILVASFIIFSAIRLIKESIDPLLGAPADPVLIQNVIAEIMKHEEILGVHDLVCHMYGPTQCFMTIHAEVDAEVDVLISHDVIDRIEDEIQQSFGISLVIHLDPVQVNCERTNQLRSKLDDAMIRLGVPVSYHDFRIVEGPTHTNVLFDVLLPIDAHDKQQEIERKIREYFKDDKTLILKIHFDLSYEEITLA